MKSKNYSDNIIQVFKKNGFILSEPDVLLDSDYIIERSGENFRKIMLTFEDDTGKSMCLRPDLTVASCIKYLKDNSKKIIKDITEPWKIHLIDTGFDSLTGGRIKRAEKIINNEQFLLTYGDAVSNVNITELVNSHNNSNKKIIFPKFNLPIDKFSIY